MQEANIMFRPYSTAVEAAMRHMYAALNERQRRLYAASEALKLGHGGIAYPEEYPDTMKIRFDQELPAWNYRAVPHDSDQMVQFS